MFFESFSFYKYLSIEDISFYCTLYHLNFILSISDGRIKIRMASFQKLWQNRFHVKEEYIKLKAVADSAAIYEYESCICIQRNFRGYRVRNRVHILKSAATEIQRIARGRKGRLIACARKSEVEVLHQSGI